MLAAAAGAPPAPDGLPVLPDGMDISKCLMEWRPQTQLRHHGTVCIFGASGVARRRWRWTSWKP